MNSVFLSNSQDMQSHRVIFFEVYLNEIMYYSDDMRFIHFY